MRSSENTLGIYFPSFEVWQTINEFSLGTSNHISQHAVMTAIHTIIRLNRTEPNPNLLVQ